MRLFSSIILILFSSALLARNPDGSWQDDGTLRYAIDRVKSYEHPYADKNQREDIPGALRLESGVQFADNCLEFGRKQGLSRKEMKKRLETLVAHSFNRMFKCAGQYFELGDYVREWSYVARRHYISCDGGENEEFAARSTMDGNVRYSSQFAKKLFEPDALEPSVSAFMHEVMHSTSLNNRHDHNDVEKVFPYSNFRINMEGKPILEVDVKCNSNTWHDRVVVVESLCSGNRSSLSINPVSIDLYLESIQCPQNNTCENVFSEAGNNIPWFKKAFGFEPSQDLEQEEAQSLCRKIKGDGLCLLARQNGKANQVIANNKNVKYFQGVMKRALNGFLPQTTRHLPERYLAAFPKLKQKLEASSCFARAFQKTRGGMVYRGMKPKKYKNRFHHFSQTMQIRNHFSGIFYDALKQAAKDQLCNSEEEEKEFIAILKELDQQMSRQAFGMAIRSAVSLADDPANWMYLAQAQREGKQSDFLNTALGYPQIKRRFFGLMSALHPQSPHFDCVAAGFHSLASMRSAQAGDGTSYSGTTNTCQ